jgi:CheY-specific phosphatase CheX
MDKEALTEAMKESISKVLETMFFLPIEPLDQATGEDLDRLKSRPLTVADLKFSGPVSGALRLYIPNELALSLTANFLGCEEGEVSQRQTGQTIQEILNMIAGNTFSELNDNAIYNLEIPENVQVQKCHSTGVEEIILRFNTLDNFFILSLNVLD